MKHRNAAKLAGIALLLSVIIFSCKKDGESGWDTEMLVPIANTSLSLQNIVKDSGRITTNQDNSLTLAYTSSLYDFRLADQLVNIPDTAIGQKFNLSALKLPNQTVIFRVSLGTLAQNMLLQPSTQFLGNLLINANGGDLPIPPLSGFNMAPFLFDASGFFDSAVLTSGHLEIWAVNHLPIAVNGADLELRNKGIPQLIVPVYHVPAIASEDSAYFEIPIAGAFITNQLEFSVTNLSTPGSNGVSVHIDTSDYIELRLFVDDIRASEAWAKFPTQNVIEVVEDVTQDIGERKFTYVDARSGQLKIDITSSVDEQLYLEYTLVGAYDNYGRPLKAFTTVPPAPVGGTSEIHDSLDMAGFAINLTGKDGTRYNTYTQKIVARMDSSGITRHITTADSVSIRYEITEVAPNYIKGYAGSDTLHNVDSADFAFLDMFKSGSIQLEDVKMNFTVENSLGIDGMVKINSLSAHSKNNGSKVLTGSVVGQQFMVGRGADFPQRPTVTNFPINNTNSNIRELLGILPNKLFYDVEVKTNVNGNNQTYRDFAYLESTLKVKLNAEIPLSLIANHLVLQDTIAFDLSGTNTDVNGISDGTLNVILQNKYPIEPVITMVIYDEQWAPVDTLLLDKKIEAGQLNNNCRVDEPKRTKIPVEVNQQRMDKIKTGRNAIITADFSTANNNQTCNGQYLKIYSDYKLDATVSAKFNYKVKTGF